MMKISTKGHEDLVKVFSTYKDFYDLYGHFIALSEEQDEAIRRNAIELEGTYDYYKILLKELEKCTNDYHNIRETLATMMYSPVRKMNTIKKNRR